jgi:hypothetical protein
MSLTSPSTDVFTSASALRSDGVTNLIKTFPSLDAALTYLAGTWQGTYKPSGPNAVDTPFTFSIDALDPNSVYRGFPQNLTPSAGDSLGNGVPFLMTWDYASNEPEHLTTVQAVFRFTPGVGIVGRAFTLGSNEHSTTFVGAGERRVDIDYQSQALANGYSVLTTYTLDESHLPFDIELTFGTQTVLNDAVENQLDDDGDPLNGPPVVGLRYRRLDDPFEITLVAVPEPTTGALAACLAIGVAMRRTRRRGRRCRHA